MQKLARHVFVCYEEMITIQSSSRLNPSISESQHVEEILERRLNGLIVHREAQRLGRAVHNLHGLARADPNVIGMVEYQKKIRDLKKWLGEELQYNPFAEPLMLVVSEVNPPKPPRLIGSLTCTHPNQLDGG